VGRAAVGQPRGGKGVFGPVAGGGKAGDGALDELEKWWFGFHYLKYILKYKKF
jgi:hypothetical protein